MKIALYAGMYKKDQDGATKTLYELVDTLLHSGIRVAIWSFNITPQERKGLTLYKLRSVPLPLYPEYRISIPDRLMEQQVREFDPDVIHITVPDIAGIVMFNVARKLKRPVVTSYHTDFPSYLKSYKLSLLYNGSWKFFKWFYNRSQRVMAPTRTIKERLERYGIRNVELWSRGIHTRLYNTGFRSEVLRNKWEAGGRKVILFVGRFVWYKNLEMFIHVYERFKQSGEENVRFVLAGDGPIRQELERRMPDAEFPGYITGQELSEVYASSDIHFFPSKTETFGNVILEGFLSGLPAVVSDIGGCRELVEESGAGIVVQGDSCQGYYTACRNLIRDEFLYNSMRERGLRFTRSRNWNMVNGRVIDQYRYLAVNRTRKDKVGAAVLNAE